ncbi:hypothetical protein BDD12DRAFT_803427 [Trichophaea hybrida]|nr:hypothetical protein BDD12DRAFT_803427 [Trichophaea hybrida]
MGVPIAAIRILRDYDPKKPTLLTRISQTFFKTPTTLRILLDANISPAKGKGIPEIVLITIPIRNLNNHFHSDQRVLEQKLHLLLQQNTQLYTNHQKANGCLEDMRNLARSVVHKQLKINIEIFLLYYAGERIIEVKENHNGNITTGWQQGWWQKEWWQKE